MDKQDTIATLAEALVNELRSSGRTVCTAESCTGGWIAKCLTDVPGSSACFAYGIVSYSNGAKESLLGVAPATLQEHGAVSESTVREMVEGALGLSGADYAVAVSGIAGPDGGSDDKPVGTVWFAWGVRRTALPLVEASMKRFTGDRDAVRGESVVTALQGIRERLRAGD